VSDGAMRTDDGDDLYFHCGSELEKRESKFLPCLIISGSSGGE